MGQMLQSFLQSFTTVGQDIMSIGQNTIKLVLHLFTGSSGGGGGGGGGKSGAPPAQYW